MAEDLYDILGVSRRATEEDIRKAFRKAAKANHPDVNPGNAAAAEAAALAHAQTAGRMTEERLRATDVAA